MIAEEKTSVPFILSLVGSLMLFIGALVWLVFSPLFGAVGLAFATVVLVATIMLYYRPQEHTTWGIIILIFGIIAFGPWNTFGGFIIGSILAIVGGALAIPSRPVPPAMPYAWPMYPGAPYAWAAPGAAPYGPYVPYPYALPLGSPPKAGPGSAAAPTEGSRATQPQVPPRFCTQCGAPAFPGAAYCGACGSKLVWGTPPPAANPK